MEVSLSTSQIQDAVAYNNKYAQSVGWAPYRAEIRKFCGMLTGWFDVDLLFAYSVADWQAKNGFAGKNVDGKLGPSTWAKLKVAMGLNLSKHRRGKTYLKRFSGSADDCKAALIQASTTESKALRIINQQIKEAITMLLKAAAKLDKSKRNSTTSGLFRKIFRVSPSHQPKWLKNRDRGEVVAIRCRAVAKLLASGYIKFFCRVRAANCPDCGNDSTPFACSSWGRESVNPKKSKVICLGSAFWKAMKNGETSSMLATIMHEPFHIYFGKLVTGHSRSDGQSVGKFGGINCITQFVFEINGKKPPARVTIRCSAVKVRN